MELFKENSVEDLLLRGYGDVHIRRVTNVSMRLHKVEYWEKLKDISVAEYCGQHLAERFTHGAVIDILNAYAANETPLRDVKVALGIMWKTEAECELGLVMKHAGFETEYSKCLTSRQQAIQNKIEKTNAERYGGKTPMSDASVREKIKLTMVKTYGVENISQLDSIKEKKKCTMLANHGVECSFQSEKLRKKATETIRERYGVDNVSQSDEIKKKKAETTFAHFGVENSLQSEDVQIKIAESLRRNYGITDDNITKPFQIKEIREKSKVTHLERYGVENPFELDSVQERIRQYWCEKYGVENPSQVLEVQKKRVATMLERFGVENPFANEDVKEKIKQTNLEKYGVEFISQSDEVQERVRQTNLERYGVENAMQLPEIKQKASDTKRENGTFNTSNPEQWLLEALVSIFGEEDVSVQYNSDARYPFHCDFYIKSRDMFIELNAFWTHGYCWFDDESIVNNIKLSEWLCGCETKNSEFYENAIRNWTINDVIKRDCARKNNLNYVVFWDSGLDDAKLWVAMGCPDGKDWVEEYSWLPKRHLSFARKLPEALSSAKLITAAVKSVNGNVFYQNEIAAWDENLPTKRGRLQGCLYANRFKYLGKLPDELTDAELLRGLSIARLVKDNYSSFNVKPMLDVFDKYGVKSVYDPCSGWGERLLACGINNIPYLGCDINQLLHPGYKALIEHYSLQNVSVVCDDSATYNATTNTHDTIFTCPPYADKEVYTDIGAENLTYCGFLDWWKNVVEHSASQSTKYFMYQIDLSHRDDMNSIIESFGFEFIEEIIVDESIRHENKARGVQKRRNYEAIQVFKRVHN